MFYKVSARYNLEFLKIFFRSRSKSVSTQKPGNLITFSAKYKINQKVNFTKYKDEPFTKTKYKKNQKHFLFHLIKFSFYLPIYQKPIIAHYKIIYQENRQ